MPTPIPGDKANHYYRGSQVAMAGAVASFVALCAIADHVGVAVTLQIAGYFCGASAGVAGALAYGAGQLVEWIQTRENAAAKEEGGQPVHQIETADIQWTARGAIPVAVPLLAVAAAMIFTSP